MVQYRTYPSPPKSVAIASDSDIDPFCDHTDPQVVALSEELQQEVEDKYKLFEVSTSHDDWEKLYTIEAFTFVRDAIKYHVLHNWTVPVSYTIDKRHGNCGSKACLLVALLRAVGIEAEFCVEKIDTKATFFFVPDAISEKCNGKSIHFSAAVKLNGNSYSNGNGIEGVEEKQWFHLDATTDWRLAVGMSGVASETFIVQFDGVRHAVAGGPTRAFRPNVARMASIQHYMRKKSRVSPHLRQCFNLAADVCRKVGMHHGCPKSLAKVAEQHLIEHHPEVFQSALDIPVGSGSNNDQTREHSNQMKSNVVKSNVAISSRRPSTSTPRAA